MAHTRWDCKYRVVFIPKRRKKKLFIESVNTSLRRVTKNRGSFPNDDALINAVLSSTAQHQKKMDNADSELESGAKSIHHNVR